MNQATETTSVRPLDERNIKAAAPGDVLRDATVRGLQLRCFANRKSFYLYYRSKAGVERRPKLGDYGTITLAQARKAAQELMAMVAAGRDPMGEVNKARAELTVAELWAEFLKRKARHNKSVSGQTWYWNKHLAPAFGQKRLGDVTYRMVADYMAANEDTPINANRSLALLSAMFNFAIRPLEALEKNPCKGVHRYKEVKRRRYMTADEAQAVAKALEAESTANPGSVAFIYLLVLTGARKGEIATAKWEWLRGNVLHLPDSKTGEKQVYLPPPAMAVLSLLPRTSGTLTGVADPKKLWDKVRKAAGCPDLRLHDLRHSFASAALSAGLSLSQIGELLGHRSTQTTKRYAHLVEDAAHSAAALAAEQIMLGMKKAPHDGGAKGQEMATEQSPV